MATVSGLGPHTLSLIAAEANTALWTEPAGLYVVMLPLVLELAVAVELPPAIPAENTPQTVETDYWMRVHQSQALLGWDATRLDTQAIVVAMEMGTPGNTASTGQVPQGRVPDATLKAHYPLPPSMLTG